MTEAFQEITFHWVDSAVVALGVLFNIATTTNPSSARPPYWRRLVDDAEGRRELARRIALVREHDDHALHGTARWHHVVEWSEANLEEEMANA